MLAPHRPPSAPALRRVAVLIDPEQRARVVALARGLDVSCATVYRALVLRGLAAAEAGVLEVGPAVRQPGPPRCNPG